jgi:mannose-6-phosphate isomerase-like protein (cupin superfamily)
MMIVRLLKDQIVNQSPTCGEVREILVGDQYPFLNVAVAHDIRPTHAHYHRGFDEIYFMLDGTLALRFYDPGEDRTWSQALGPDELCVISKGIHHVVTEAATPNRLCVITVPRFDPEDEHLSDRL